MGRKHSAPDNMFHQILASGGYDLPRSTRITLSTAFGWMLQDEDFLPYSINSALSATTQAGAATDGTDLAALPRSSLDGEIFTTVVDFRVTSRPIEKLDLGLGYHFDNRENNTPRDTYVRIRADSENQATTLDTGNARINLPYSYTEHRVAADAGYRIWRRTNLKLSYEWQLTERDFQEVDELTEHTLGASLTSQPWSFLGARIRYAHAWRNGDDYVGNRPFIDGHTPIYADSEREDCEDDLAGLVNPALVLPASECPFENHPLLRKSYLANRQRDEVKLTLNLTPHEDVRFAVYLNYVNEDYDDSEIGLTNVLNWSPGFDLSYSPFERLTTHAFYSYMDFRTKQTGWSFSGGNLDHVTDPTRRWKTSDQDRTHTFGLGFNLGILPGRLDFGSDYLYAYSEGQIETSGFGSVIPYPDNRSRQHNVSVHANYRFTENITMRVGYLFAYFDQRDWALDGLDVDSLNFSGNAAVIGSGRDSEDYRANVVSWSVSYRFW
jgi:MtrB/PioB family decaheme-associated outer membrane protein